MRELELLFICATFICGFFGVYYTKNIIKKLLMLGVMNVATIGIFLYIGSTNSTVPPILQSVHSVITQQSFSDPLPQALVLTAVVIGFATQSLSLVFAMYLSKSYDTVEEDKIEKLVEEERRGELEP
ncbi:MAG: multicomponent Na+:H+ antiporter subunit [Thermotogaceae bacterium]|jgi:multicomponent Na+:H+ antiporter subunit C|nr:multicomponent Na+:H+ antiporter subunit [Thermotogaceae bacterium]